MKKIALIAFLAVLMGTGSLLSGKSPGTVSWKYWKTKKNVRLYKRNYPDSGIIEVKAVTIIEAAPEVIESVIRDIPAYPEFMYNCIEGREIKRYSDENIIILNVTKMPWPLKPRDVVVTTRVKKDFARGKFEVALVGLKSPRSEQYVPPIKGHVRMYNLTGTFKCELLERKKCRMTYIVHADPRGLPSFMVNLFVDDNPFGTLRGIQRMVKKEKYIQRGRKSRYLGMIEKYYKSRNDASK